MALRLPLGTEAELWASVLALAFTYGAHALVWAAAVALLVASKAVSPATRHACWKTALFGPLLSAALATTTPLGFAQRVLEGSGSDAVTTDAASAVAARSAADAVLPCLPTARTLAQLGLLSVAVGLLHFGVSAYLLQRSLRGRTSVTDPGCLIRFTRLRASMGIGSVRLSVSDTLLTPLVIGTREVCVPRRLFSELVEADMDAVLAHELAHVERRDGLWFPLVALVQSALWLQPLNHLVSSYIRHSAELACDDRAVELTGSPLGLARALVHVAERAAQARHAMSAPAMARQPSSLLPRVRRLTNGRAFLHSKARACGRWRTWLSLLAIGAGLATLSVRVSGARAASANAGPRATERGTAVFPVAPPDAAAQSARMAELATREQALLVELATVEGRPTARIAGTSDQVRALELNQELRHVRATQAWLEERFVAEWAAFEARSHARR